MGLWVGLEQTQGGGDTTGHANHAKSITKSGSRLGREATKGTDTSKTGSKVCHLVNFRVALGHGVTVGAQESSGGNTHQHCVLRGVRGPLEHVQHALGHDEPTKDIDEGDESCTSGQCLDGVGGVKTSTHQEHSSHSSDTRDCVGNGRIGRTHSKGIDRSKATCVPM